jgi:hypothetical protein
MNNSIGVITNANGRQSVDISASKYVQDVNMTVYASTVNNTMVSNSIILRFIAGEPSSLNVYANPYVVASADVLTPQDMPDVHRTDVTAVVTDEWGHPIVGQSVSISSSNVTQGSITGPAAGVTSDSGEFTTQFTLGSGMYGEDLTNGVTVNAVSGSLSGTCQIYYTDNSFLSVKSTIEPNTSVKVNDTNGNNVSTDYMYTSDAQNSQNENFIRFGNASAGRYEIYGSYAYDPAKGDVPYNMMVLTSPKRLGQASDYDSAAKVAAKSFVANMTNSQIDVVWFNVSSNVVKHFTVDDSFNRSSINASIDGLSARGGTSIYLGLDKAIGDFNSPYYKSGNKKVIILLSDGYSQTPTNDLASAETAADQNITIYTIGMGMPDDVNLGAIANATTGGNYSRVYTDAQLNDVYSGICRDLQDVVANYTEMHILSNCTYVDSNWLPDVEYIMGSGYVSYPNGTERYEDPDPLPAPDPDGTYSIVWKPGVIKLNDTYSVTYSLKVLRDGNITPIRNDSYIYFIRDDGSNDIMHFGSETLYVRGNSNDTMAQSNSTIKVDITNPLPKMGAKADWPSQPIEWQVNYAGNGTYHQIIYLIDTNSVEIPVSEGYNSNANDTFSYSLPTKSLSDGNYIIRVYADDGDDTGEDLVTLIVSESKGQIILE